MRRWLCLTLIALCSSGALGAPTPYADRLVWVFGLNLRRDNDLTAITNLLATAARSGLNGAVLSAGLDSLCKQGPDFLQRLRTVREASERLGLDLIPSVFSAGYGGGALGHDRHLAEGVPVEEALFVAGTDEAVFVPDSEVGLVNGGFEEFTGNKLKGFNLLDQPGVVGFVDAQVKRSGQVCLRLENFTSNPHGHGRVMQEVRVRPRRAYRVSVWVKTEGLSPTRAFRLLALAGNRDIAPRTFDLPATGDWRRLTMVFNSLGFSSVRLYAGLWKGQAGKVWLDDWTVEEIGPLNVLRRPGTPVTVRSDDGQVNYVEGRDFEPLQDPNFNFYRVDREPPALKLPAGTRIRPGQRLRVSWYHPMVINESQISLCMAEPALYEIWDHEARLLAEQLRPRRVLLNMDEVRMGGTCRACQGRHMGQLLGECITRQTEILRRHLPEAEVYVWSDMLDPQHNARPNYYLVEGDYTGSWNHVPKDLIIAVWGGAPREKSLRFFADEGFRTLIACYYDAEDLEHVKGWLQLARQTPNVRGLMYTPWQRRYGLLPEFGRLLQTTP